jgi:hypothetical protein
VKHIPEDFILDSHRQENPKCIFNKETTSSINQTTRLHTQYTLMLIFTAMRTSKLLVIKETAGFAETWYHPSVYTDITKQKKSIFIVIAVKNSNLEIHLVT